MSSSLHLYSTARNLVSVSEFGYGENIRVQQIGKSRPSDVLPLKRINFAASAAKPSRDGCEVSTASFWNISSPLSGRRNTTLPQH
ncbi:hypothetical protein CWR43_18615 [Rhizobium sullae]|uniref:Uncharacterized protein n=1 Tax=Rhizobium sullae TaxID=50338 RepID=A0A2N0D7T2_RHISU|nr:hypothetical protein CWR43_18615 [Rhizobium sullae]